MLVYLRRSYPLMCGLIVYIYVYILILHGKPALKNSNRIMYLVRTSAKLYEQRLIHLLETWIEQVSDDTYFVSDLILPKINRHHQLLTQKTCGTDKHTLPSLCCKTAHEFLFYNHLFDKYDWFCHFDDDQYVNVNNLNHYLSKFDTRKAFYIGRNSWPNQLKRSKEPYPHAFWFATLGAGVCLSKRVIVLLRPYTLQPTEFVDGCRRENYHDDIYVGFLINAYLNTSLTKSNLFHSHLEKFFYQDEKKFQQIFKQQITFGFRRPDRYPNFLPDLFPHSSDPYRMQTLHCLLHSHLRKCKHRYQPYFFNKTSNE